MSRAAAVEFATAGVRVNSVYPSSVRTAMVESDARDTGISATEFVTAAAALSPLGRIAEPEDVADAVLFLSSAQSRLHHRRGAGGRRRSHLQRRLTPLPDPH